MRSLAKLWAASVLFASSFLLISDHSRSGFGQQPAVPAQDGVEVQARGPIHEAFMEPGALEQAPSPIVLKKPPEAINELPSEDRPQGDQFQWLPGYWAWDDDRGDYLWVSGIWRAAPPGRQWAPGYWLQADGGWQWVTGYWSPVAEATVDLLPPPPELIEEAIPPAPDQNSVFLPGIWVYQHDRHQYWWRPGHWVHQRPGWIWMPACYHWTPGGYVFVNGYWDHEIGDRGIAFAPVYFNPGLVVRPGWYYRPAYALAVDALLHSLFVRTGVGAGHYWFGDYYDPAYVRRGYTPWIEQRVANVHDPLYSYYRWQHRDQPRWEQEIRSTYATRRDNQAARPARTLVEQNRAGANATARVVVPTREARPAVKTEPLPKARAEEIHKSVEEWRRLGQERLRLETKAKPAPPIAPPTTPTVKPTPAPATPAAPATVAPARVERPKTTIAPPRVDKAPPPPPTHPAPAPKPPPPRKEPPHKEKEKDKKEK